MHVKADERAHAVQSRPHKYTSYLLSLCVFFFLFVSNNPELLCGVVVVVALLVCYYDTYVMRTYNTYV